MHRPKTIFARQSYCGSFAGFFFYGSAGREHNKLVSSLNSRRNPRGEWLPVSQFFPGLWRGQPAFFVCFREWPLTSAGFPTCAPGNLPRPAGWETLRYTAAHVRDLLLSGQHHCRQNRAAGDATHQSLNQRKTVARARLQGEVTQF